MIDPITAAALNPLSAGLQPTGQSTGQSVADSSTLTTSWTNGPDVLKIRATDMAPSQSPNPLNSGAVNNLATGVHGGLENLKSSPAASAMQIDNTTVANEKKALAATFDENGNSVLGVTKKTPVQDAVIAIEKTFDHALFSAMVTQVASGVSNSVRMLARQS